MRIELFKEYAKKMIAFSERVEIILEEYQKELKKSKEQFENELKNNKL